MTVLADAQFEAALKAVEDSDASAEEKAEMLMEIAMGLQQRPKSPKQIEDAIELYGKALNVCPEAAVLLAARIKARQATAYYALPSGTNNELYRAEELLKEALAVLSHAGLKEEAGETEMNLGLVLQSLAQNGGGKLQDAISHYHNALRIFTREEHPQDFAILHNNLAIAYLSMPLTDPNGKMREALAVRSFEEVLKVINIVDHPSEYAMIQNNLGNALQYVSSSHAFENNMRAIDAYDEALRVRNERDTPMEFANTIANKANVLRNLPDDPEDPEKGNRENLRSSRELYVRAKGIFESYGRIAEAVHVAEAIEDIDRVKDVVQVSGSVA